MQWQRRREEKRVKSEEKRLQANKLLHQEVQLRNPSTAHALVANSMTHSMMASLDEQDIGVCVCLTM